MLSVDMIYSFFLGGHDLQLWAFFLRKIYSCRLATSAEFGGQQRIRPTALTGPWSTGILPPNFT